MTPHAQSLATFLQTDLYRLETALEEQVWTEDIATRLNDHLHRLTQLLALVTNIPPDKGSAPNSIEDAFDTLHSLTEALLESVASLPETCLNAMVLDPYERNLTLLAHLYDYARLSAMLVEWSHHLTPAPTLDDWFEAKEE